MGCRTHLFSKLCTGHDVLLVVADLQGMRPVRRAANEGNSAPTRSAPGTFLSMYSLSAGPICMACLLVEALLEVPAHSSPSASVSVHPPHLPPLCPQKGSRTWPRIIPKSLLLALFLLLDVARTAPFFGFRHRLLGARNWAPGQHATHTHATMTSQPVTVARVVPASRGCASMRRLSNWCTFKIWGLQGEVNMSALPDWDVTGMCRSDSIIFAELQKRSHRVELGQYWSGSGVPLLLSVHARGSAMQRSRWSSIVFGLAHERRVNLPAAYTTLGARIPYPRQALAGATQSSTTPLASRYALYK